MWQKWTREGSGRHKGIYNRPGPWTDMAVSREQRAPDSGFGGKGGQGSGGGMMDDSIPLASGLWEERQGQREGARGCFWG